MKKVVIVGSGFGGIDTALRIREENEDLQITVVDKKSHFTYQVGLHELVSKKIRAKSIRINLAKLYRKHNIKFYREEAVEVDPLEKSVTTMSRKLGFDYLVIAVGGTTNYFSIPGAKANSFGLKTVKEALGIRTELKKQLDRAKYYNHPINIVVVGGGLTGIETAAEIKDYTKKKANVILLEALPDIMKGFNKETRAYCDKILKKKGIDINTSCCVEKVEHGKIYLEDDKPIDANLLVWCAGIKANPVTNNMGLKTNDKGSILINNYLQTNHPDIYAVGDCSYMYQNPQPMTALIAIMESKTVVHNILADINKEEKIVFKKEDYPYLISLGRGRGVLLQDNKVKKGLLPAIMKKLLRKNYVFSHRHWVWPFNKLEG